MGWGRKESDDRIEGSGDRMIANAHLADPRHLAAAAAIQSLCQIQQLRAQELCESRGGRRPRLPSLIVFRVSVDIKQHRNYEEIQQLR